MKQILKTTTGLFKHQRRLPVHAKQAPFSYFNYKNTGPEHIVSFLKDQGIEYKLKHNGQIVAKYCPLCRKPHNNDVTNMWTLNVKTPDGAYLCFRCGEYGNWTDFVKKIVGEEIMTFSDQRQDSENDPKVSPETVEKFYKEKLYNLEKAHVYITSRNAPQDAEPIEINEKEVPKSSYVRMLEYLTNGKKGRGLTVEVLKKFGIGIGEEMFRNNEGELELVPCIYFPMHYKSKVKANIDWKIMKTKIRGAGSQYKKFQRMFPTGTGFGVFGAGSFPKQGTPEAVVITEGEFDAMAVHQATGLPVLSLPYGASNLPKEMLPYLNDVKRIYLWMDFDEIGQMNIQVFAEKLGLNRTYVVKELSNIKIAEVLNQQFNQSTPNLDHESTKTMSFEALTKALDGNENSKVPQTEEEIDRKKIKDANDVLKLSPILIQEFIRNAKPFPQDNIILFSHLRDAVRDRIFNEERFRGVKSGYFKWFNGILKGFRRGE